jgi:hypothetical protein
MPNTTWNPSDKSANITLSVGNLVATSITISMVTARAVDSRTSGKYYWECLCNTFTSGTSAVGMAPSTAALNAGIASGGSGAGTFGLNRNGAIVVSAVASGVTFGTITSGSLICLAVDLSAQRVWCRLGAAGNWNNNVANNPATGVGGVAITLGAALAGFPAVSLFANGDQVTANFGDSAFTGAPPSGFAAGFPGPPVVPDTQGPRVMVLA